MNLREFNEQLATIQSVGPLAPVTDQALYDTVIEPVYAWHPAIPEQGGKLKIAKLYALGGIGLLESMLPVAMECKGYEERIAEARRAMEEAAGLLREVRRRFEPAKEGVKTFNECEKCGTVTDQRLHVWQTEKGEVWVCPTCNEAGQ